MIGPISCSMSGSFTRGFGIFQQDFQLLNSIGFRVHSPKHLNRPFTKQDFVYLEGQDHLHPKAIETEHLSEIRLSDFLWLVCVDGYVGPSATLELGYAVAFDIPIFSSGTPDDPMIANFVIKKTIPELAEYFHVIPGF
jgi:nucleoside 2-deoxyribosyltransferase